MSSAVLILDLGSAGWPVLSATPDAAELTGHTHHEVLHRTWPHFWEPAQPDLAPLAFALGGREDLPPSPLSTLRHDGTRFEAEAQLLVAGAVGVLTLSDRAASEAARLAFQCPLTGVRNRAGLQRDLTAALSRALRTGTAIACVFVDLNDFKTVNDRWGHAAGDQVLQEVAHRLRSAVRTHDIIARPGGDEFVIVLTDLGDDPAQDAGCVAAKLAAVLAEPVVFDGGVTWDAEASIGLSMFPEDAHDAEALLAAADARMYRDKRFARLDVQRRTADLVARAVDAARDGGRLRVRSTEVLEIARHSRFERAGTVPRPPDV